MLKIKIEGDIADAPIFSFLHLIGEEVEEDPDIIFVEVCPDKIFPFCKKYEDSLKIGFQRGQWWHHENYNHSGLMRKTIEPLDVVGGWTSNLLWAAESMNKKIWDFPYLMEGTILSSFEKERQNNPYIAAVNVFQPRNSMMMFGDSIEFMSLNPNYKYFMPYVRNTPPELRFLSDVPNITAKDRLGTEIWHSFLIHECAYMLQHSFTVTTGKSCIDATRCGVPSIASGYYYQKILFPELIIRDMKEAEELLNVRYEDLEAHVIKAQKCFNYFNLANPVAVEELKKYVQELYDD